MTSKYEELLKYISKFQKAAVAFSGGVDSTFLLRACKEAIGNNVIAITVITPYIPEWEISEARENAQALGIRLETITTPIIESIKNNPPDRCYHCKKFLFKNIKEKAKQLGIDYVFDGTNFDDTKEYRPGLRALEELNIVSPLKEMKMTKNEIRLFSQKLGIRGWDKPSCACILSRIPYNTMITADEIKKIESSEEYLKELGFTGARVRSHGDIARIELRNDDMTKFLNHETCNDVAKKIKSFGYSYVTLDIEGYRTGSLNQDI